MLTIFMDGIDTFFDIQKMKNFYTPLWNFIFGMLY
jgi:hypothetical protein